MRGFGLRTAGWSLLNVTIRHLKAALSVARHKSFRKAAEELHITQPALSISVGDLEDELGLSLFDRTSRVVTITDHGQEFLREAERIVADFNKLIQDTVDISRSSRGHVLVSCLSSIAGKLMPRVLLDCEARFPNVDVTVRDEAAACVFDAVQRGEADFGISVKRSKLAHGLVTEKLFDDRYFVVAPKSHALAERDQLSWSDLAGVVHIAFTPASGTQAIVEQQLRRHKVRLARSIAAQQLATVNGMLEAGVGICVLPEIALPHPEHPTLVALPLRDPPLFREIVIVTWKDRSLSPAAAALKHVVVDLVRTQKIGEQRSIG